MLTLNCQSNQIYQIVRFNQILIKFMSEDSRKNFSHQNLKGHNFSGQDLREADFTECDIRGADFSYAYLIGANFTKVKAGLETESIVILCFVAFVLSLISGLLIFYQTSFVLKIFSFSSEEQISGLISLVTIIICYIFTVRIEFLSKLIDSLYSQLIHQKVLIKTIKKQGTLTTLFFLFVIVFRFVPVLCISALITVALLLLQISSFFILMAIINNEEQILLTIILAISEVLLGIVIGLFNVVSTLNQYELLILALLTLSLLAVSFYMSQYLLLEDDFRYKFIKHAILRFCSIGGTSFHDANLSYANFNDATLANTNFHKSNITQTNFKNSKGLNLCRAGNTILNNDKVLKLLVTGNGDATSYKNLNLQGANLRDAHLNGSDFSGTNICDSDVTGAFIDWKIDKETKLDNVQCQFAYFKGVRQEFTKPSSEFKKFCQKNITQSLNNKSKTRQTKTTQNNLVRDTDCNKDLTSNPPQPTINVNVSVNTTNSLENKTMNNNSTDQSRNMRVNGNINNSGAGAFNQGNISDSTISNSINELPKNQSEIKEILQELQECINDPELTLTEEHKNLALSSLQSLVEVAKNPKDEGWKKKAQEGISILTLIGGAIAPSIKLFTFCQDKLPLLINWLRSL